MADREPIGVIGAGWVGLVTAACFADLGHDVWVRDVVQEKIDTLAKGDVPIYEPGLPELITKNSERLHWTLDMSEVVQNSELLFCCVDTPPTYSGDADLSRVMQVVEEIGDLDSHALIMKSTVPVSTGRSIKRRLQKMGYVSNPEFLKEGSAIADFQQPDRVVVGAGREDADFGDRVEKLYEPLEAPMVRTDVASAEMIKLASNAFLATKISFINEIANVSEELGADVEEVARGMGLDSRIGPQFLRAGSGFGGSCFAGDETVLARRQGRVWIWTYEEMWRYIAEEQDLEPAAAGALEPAELEVLSWRPRSERPEFMPVAALTKRDYDGELIEVRTKMGRRVRVTPDHPFVVTDGTGDELAVKTAAQLGNEDWLPVAQGAPVLDRQRWFADPVALAFGAEVEPSKVLVRLGEDDRAAVAAASAATRNAALAGRSSPGDVLRTGVVHLDEAARLEMSLDGASYGTVRNGTWMPVSFKHDERFWRIVGLYIAEGHRTSDGARRRIQWTFNPDDEPHLVDEVVQFFTDHGVKTTVRRTATAMTVSISSRLLDGYWDDLGLGKNCYEQRIPDLIWAEPQAHKRALLAGAWLGDGSWSLVAGGPSVVLEYGTASAQLADGMLRLLGELGIVARWKVGRTKKSTVDNHWLVIAGAEQVERMLDLVGPADEDRIRESLARQAKRIKPTGYRRHAANSAWVRVTHKRAQPYRGPVYSLEVPDAHTVVTTGGLVAHNCFPKDVSALKQLAGNSGYHFQLLTAVIEVNELQKRRIVGKLQKHLGSLIGKEIALLGLAFKPNTDDIREATALVLAARLQSEGAHVRVFDPVAMERAAELIGGAKLCDSALDALDGADGAVLVTEWPEFAQLDWTGEVKERMANPLVVDGRNFLDRDALVSAGFTYEGVGRSTDVTATPVPG
jgi:UDPglucose 6-dehydrogenase